MRKRKEISLLLVFMMVVIEESVVRAAFWPVNCGSFEKMSDRLPQALHIDQKQLEATTDFTAQCEAWCDGRNDCGSYAVTPDSGWCVLYGVSVQLVDEEVGMSGTSFYRRRERPEDPLEMVYYHEYLYGSKACDALPLLYSNLPQCSTTYHDFYIDGKLALYLVNYDNMTSNECEVMCRWFDDCKSVVYLTDTIRELSYCRLMRKSVEELGGAPSAQVFLNTQPDVWSYLTMDRRHGQQCVAEL